MRIHNHSKFLLVMFFFLAILVALNAGASEWKLKISVEKANIHREPNAESPIVSTTLKGTILDSYEKIGDWFRVIIGPDEKGFTVIGYIHSSDAQVLKEKISKEPDFWEVEPEFFRGIGLSVKLSGGLSYFGSGDIDRGIRGLFDSKADSLSTAGYLIDERTDPLHTGIEISGDIIYSIKPRIGIGLGIDYIYATVKNLLIVMGKELPTEQQISSSPKINAVPIRLGVFFKFPLHRLFSISVSGGPSLYLTEYSYALDTSWGWEDFTSIFQEAKAKSFGFHGEIGLEVNMSRRAVFFIEGQGRYAKISNFEGEEKTKELVYLQEEKYIGYDYIVTKEKGKLYYMEDGQYPYLAIREEEPSGFKNMRKATFDLSGLSLRAGLIIKF
jgi:hypothetical protein